MSHQIKSLSHYQSYSNRIFYFDKIDNDLSTSRNVSSNKILHVILALVF